jgi:hypothetical protein
MGGGVGWSARTGLACLYMSNVHDSHVMRVEHRQTPPWLIGTTLRQFGSVLRYLCRRRCRRGAARTRITYGGGDGTGTAGAGHGNMERFGLVPRR